MAQVGEDDLRLMHQCTKGSVDFVARHSPTRTRKLHEQYKPEAQASEYCGLFTRLRFGRFGLVFVASRSKSVTCEAQCNFLVSEGSIPRSRVGL